VTGRLISADGTLLARAPIRTDSALRGWQWSLGLATGADGRFRVELPAGGPFALQSQWIDLVKNLTVEAGEQIDLGDITIEPGRNGSDPKAQRGKEKRTKLRAAARASTTSTWATSKSGGVDRPRGTAR
jgi:hypothetical protein